MVPRFRVDSTRVVLSVRSQMQVDLIERILVPRAGLEIVGRADDPLGVMSLISRHRADIWMHSWQEGPELRGLLSHLRSQFPALAVVHFDPDEVTGVIQTPIDSIETFAELLPVACGRGGRDGVLRR